MKECGFQIGILTLPKAVNRLKKSGISLPEKLGVIRCQKVNKTGVYGLMSLVELQVFTKVASRVYRHIQAIHDAGSLHFCLPGNHRLLPDLFSMVNAFLIALWRLPMLGFIGGIREHKIHFRSEEHTS